jgi:hypothetical protein
MPVSRQAYESFAFHQAALLAKCALHVRCLENQHQHKDYYDESDSEYHSDGSTEKFQHGCLLVTASVGRRCCNTLLQNSCH